MATDNSVHETYKSSGLMATNYERDIPSRKSIREERYQTELDGESTINSRIRRTFNNKSDHLETYAKRLSPPNRFSYEDSRDNLYYEKSDLPYKHDSDNLNAASWREDSADREDRNNRLSEEEKRTMALNSLMETNNSLYFSVDKQHSESRASYQWRRDKPNRELEVALVNCNHTTGQITEDQWKLVDEQLLKGIIAKVDVGQPAPVFQDRGFLYGTKKIYCENHYTLEWLHSLMPSLNNIWPGAQLKIVNKLDVINMPTGSVNINRDIDPEMALKIMQSKNPDLPTSDWSIVLVTKHNSSVTGYNLIIKINAESENLLYRRKGRLEWIEGNLYMRIKKRNILSRMRN